MSEIPPRSRQQTDWQVFLGRMRILGAILLVIAAFIGLEQVALRLVLPPLQSFAARTLPAEQDNHYKELALVTAEASALKDYPGSNEGGLTQSAGSHGIFIRIEYTHPDACQDVKRYYATEAPAKGWAPYPQGESLGGGDSYYRKQTNGQLLELAVECYNDDQYYDIEVSVV